jgi:hypothetical protein
MGFFQIRGEVADELMAQEIEVYPGLCAAAFTATESLAIKAAGSAEIINFNREMKRADFLRH